MARRSSKRAGGKDQQEDAPRDELAENTESGAATDTPEATEDAGRVEPAAEETVAEPVTEPVTEAELTEPDSHVPPEGEPQDPEAAASETTEASVEKDTVDPDAARDAEASTDAAPAESASEPPPDLETPAEPAAAETRTVETRTIVERTGPGFVPLVLGGVVAAGLGYLASVYEVIPGLGGADDGTAQIEATLAQQSETLATLQAQLAEMAPTEAPAVDLSPVTDRIDAIGARLDETAAAIETLTGRVATLEERPVFSGDVSADAAEAAEAVAAMEERVRAQEEEAARLAAEAEAAQAEAAEAIAAAEAEAQAAAAAAEEEARAATAAAEAEAALQSLRLAVTSGAPYADALATIDAAVEVPDPLAANADSGVASLETLQDSFPAAARAALPVGLRETAGEGTMDRLGAFLQGQIGGRSIEPREGDDPDAVLSRAQAAVDAGDLQAALDEIAALPEGAQAEMAGWTDAARTRLEVTAALETVSQALAGGN